MKRRFGLIKDFKGRIVGSYRKCGEELYNFRIRNTKYQRYDFWEMLTTARFADCDI